METSRRAEGKMDFIGNRLDVSTERCAAARWSTTMIL